MRSQVLAFFYEIQIGPQTTNKPRERNPRPRRIVDTQLSRVKWPEALKVWIASGTGDLHLAAMANCAGVETGCRSNWVCLRPQQKKTANRLFSLIYYRIVLLKKSGGFASTAGDATVQCLEVHLANDCTISGLQSAEKLQKTLLNPPHRTPKVSTIRYGICTNSFDLWLVFVFLSLRTSQRVITTRIQLWFMAQSEREDIWRIITKMKLSFFPRWWRRRVCANHNWRVAKFRNWLRSLLPIVGS